MTCPDEHTLSRFVRAELPDADEEAIERHLEVCADCRARLEEQERSEESINTPALRYVRDGLTKALEANEITEDEELESALQTDPTSLDNDEPDAIPDQIGAYRIATILGRGGMGTVYRGEHVHLKRPAAIKVVRESRRLEPQAVARFYREMEAIGKLRHPNIVQAFDAGECDGRPYIVMELLEGTDLSALVKRDGLLSPNTVFDLIRQAALGLQHAHENGLIHRDVKPSNLWLTNDGTVKLLDLGLARVAESTTYESVDGHVVGSRGYLSPEQAQGVEVDCRSDIYSLGRTLLFLLGCNEAGLNEPGTVSPDLAPLLNKMLAVDPANRFGTMQELVAAIDDLELPRQTSVWKKASLFFVLAAVALFSGIALRSSGIFERNIQQPSGPGEIVERIEPPPTSDEEPWMTTKEIAEHLSVHENTVYRWIDKQGMPAHRAGRAWRFKKSEVDAWIKTQEKKK